MSFIYVISLWLQLITVTACFTLIKLLQENTSWDVKVSAENEGAATCFNGCVGRCELQYMFKAIQFYSSVFSLICYVHLYFLDFTFFSVLHTLYMEGSVAACLIYNISLCSRNFFVQREFQTCPNMVIHTVCCAIQDFLGSLLEILVTHTVAGFLNGCLDFWSWWCRGHHDSSYIWITTTDQGHPCFSNTAPAKVSWFVTCNRNK